MSTLTNAQVKYLVKGFLKSYKKSLRESMVFLAPLLKAKEEKMLTSMQSRYFLAACEEKARVVWSCGFLTNRAIDVYSDMVANSDVFAEVA